MLKDYATLAFYEANRTLWDGVLKASIWATIKCCDSQITPIQLCCFGKNASTLCYHRFIYWHEKSKDLMKKMEADHE